MNPRHEDLVHEGLDAITSGRTDLDAFLAAHPGDADDLRAVLEMAVALDRAVSIEPRPAFRYAARADFADRVQARSRRSWFSGWTLALRPVTVGLFAIVVASSLGFGTVAASEDSTPGQPLYGVKLAQESLRLAITRDELDRAGLRARFADRRVEELSRVGGDPSAEQRSYLAKEVAANLQSVAQTVERERQQGGPRPETRAKLARIAAQLQSSRISDPEVVRRVLAQTPPEQRPLIMRLLQLAQEEYQRTLQSLPAEGDMPAQVPPENRSAPGQRPPDARSTPTQRTLDPRPVPGQRSLDERPAPERRPTAARPALDERVRTERQTPGARTPNAQAALDQPARIAPPTVSGLPADQAVAGGEPPTDHGSTDAGSNPDSTPADGLRIGEPAAGATAAPSVAPPDPTPGSTGINATRAPDQPTPRPTATPVASGTQATPTRSAPELRPTSGRATPTLGATADRPPSAFAPAPAARP